MTVSVPVAVARALRVGCDGSGEHHDGTRRCNGEPVSDRHYCVPACVVVFFFALVAVVADGVGVRRSAVVWVSARSISVGAFAVFFTAWMAWPRLPVCVAVGGAPLVPGVTVIMWLFNSEKGTPRLRDT